MKSIANRIAPWRFLLFFALLFAGWWIGVPQLGWSQGLLAGFDIAAIAFIAAYAPTFGYDSERLRAASADNDANRAVLLVVSFLLTIIILAAVIGEVSADQIGLGGKLLAAASLVMVWMFANAVYTLHYCHLFYTKADGGRDSAGLVFPETAQPLMSDFVYFAYTLGVAVQTSDVMITSSHIRKVVTAHAVAGFFFNLGVLALTINVLAAG